MAPPTRTDDQILPLSRWVPIGKINCYLDVDRSQSNPIYKITVDILKCQLDEQWFDLTKYTLRDALQITPVDNNNAFSSPPTPDTLIKFVNDLGYPKVIRTLSDVHKFHPRPGSPLHLPNEEYVLGYLKFCAKGTKREVFGMPIPNDLITDDIRGEQYYNAYLEKVAKHQRYLAGEEVSDPDSPAPKLAKATKPKATKQSKPLAPKATPITKPAAAKTSKLTSSQQPKPKPAPAKTQKKKQKLVTKTSEASSPAKRSKAGKVVKKRTQKSSLQLVDEFVDEGVLVNDPRIGDEEADMQKAVEESLKEFYEARQGPLPLVVIREPESGKFQPLPEVHGKGKEKRHTPAPTESLGHVESPSLYAEISLTDSDTESDEEVPPVVKSGAQNEGQAVQNPGVQDEDQAGPNPGVLNKGQAGPNPGEHDEG
ncbi:retrovirus-related pol polyprotein from transposon TNT 1-94 [Tanacetum coccineum]